MSCRLPALWVILLVLSSSQATEAHLPRVDTIYAVQFPNFYLPLIDGDLSDWDVVPQSPEVNIFDTQSAQRDIDVNNFSFRMMVGWNDCTNKLYLMTEVYDNIHQSGREDPLAYGQDDTWEIVLNPNHSPTDRQNLEGEPVNTFSYIFAVPPVEDRYQFYRPLAHLPWLVDGSAWVEFAWDFSGKELGESTYNYELALTPIRSMPSDVAAAPEEVEIYDLEPGAVIHLSMGLNDVDAACIDCTAESGQGFWGVSPLRNGTSTIDIVLASEVIDLSMCLTIEGAECPPTYKNYDNIGRIEDASCASFGPTTVVSPATWGQLKARVPFE